MYLYSYIYIYIYIFIIYIYLDVWMENISFDILITHFVFHRKKWQWVTWGWIDDERTYSVKQIIRRKVHLKLLLFFFTFSFKRLQENVSTNTNCILQGRRDKLTPPTKLYAYLFVSYRFTFYFPKNFII